MEMKHILIACPFVQIINVLSNYSHTPTAVG